MRFSSRLSRYSAPTGAGKPDPLAGLWEEEILPLLEQTPGLRPVTVLEQIQLRHPDRDLNVARRTLAAALRAGAQHPDRDRRARCAPSEGARLHIPG